MSDKKNHMKLVWGILFVVVLFTISILYFGVIQKKHERAAIKIEGVVLPEAKPVAAFHFQDQLGQPFSNQNLKDHWSLLFFGFTNCGFVCPTTLTELNKMIKVLQQEIPDNQIPQVILVTVDPERDTVKRLREYVAAFNADFKAIRADLEATEQFENALHISAVKMQADGTSDDQYMINHSAEILLINPEGNIQAYFSYPHKADQMVKDYKRILNSIG